MIVPLVVPFTSTFTPIIGSPVLSFTKPVAVWAKATKQSILKKRVETAFLANSFRFIRCVFIVIKMFF